MTFWAASCYLCAFALSLASLGLSVRMSGEPVRRPGDPQHLLSLVVAALTLALALASPLDALGDRLFSAHMVEHELFLYTIPIALLAAQPVPLALINLRRLPLTWRRSVGRVSVRHPGFLRVIARLGRPIPALMLSGLALWAWHAPALYDLALRNQWLHGLEHASFLAAALVYWRPLLNGKGHAAALGSNAKRAFYLIAGGMQGGLLGALIALDGQIAYAGYLVQPGASMEAVLADQRLGGSIMWFSGPVFCGVIAAAVMR